MHREGVVVGLTAFGRTGPNDQTSRLKSRRRGIMARWSRKIYGVKYGTNTADPSTWREGGGSGANFPRILLTRFHIAVKEVVNRKDRPTTTRGEFASIYDDNFPLASEKPLGRIRSLSVILNASRLIASREGPSRIWRDDEREKGAGRRSACSHVKNQNREAEATSL